MTRPQWFYEGLLAAAAYAALPLALFNYSWPPGDDPGRLWAQLQGGLGIYRYYGHLPALAIGMAAYYWLTPVIVYLGLWLAFSRYGWLTPLLIWATLFLLARPLLFDLRAGTFIQAVNLYGLGLPLLRLGSRQPRWLLAAPLLIAFHTHTGLLVTGVAAAMLIYSQEWRKFGILAGLGAAAALTSGLLLRSSARHLERLATLSKLAPPVSPATWLHDYLGLGAVMLLLACGALALAAWRGGWKPERDSLLVGIAAALIPLGVLTFTPWTTNADREAKLFTELLLLLALAVTPQALAWRGDKRLWLGAGLGFAALLGLTTPDVLPYWLGMGSYR